MNFYLDFEATQFSNKIISIGCVAANGNSFYTLVNPGEKEKFSSFIMELTGITKEMVSEAPSPDEAFWRLFNFIEKETPYGEEPKYFCYGDNDKEFIKCTIKNMVHTRSIMIAQSIIYALTDYSIMVKKYFQVDQPIALRKISSFIQEKNVVQHHNALEDAQMLYEVADKLKDFCNPEDVVKIKNIPSQKKPKTTKRVSNTFLSLEGPMWKCNTGNINDYQIKCYGRGNNTKYFKNMEIAVMWVIKYLTGGSPKEENIIKSRRKNIKKAIVNNSTYCGLHWEIR